jgi:hypothetical protein
MAVLSGKVNWKNDMPYGAHQYEVCCVTMLHYFTMYCCWQCRGEIGVTLPRSHSRHTRVYERLCYTVNLKRTHIASHARSMIGGGVTSVAVQGTIPDHDSGA